MASMTNVGGTAAVTRPIQSIGPIAWMRANLFSGWVSSVLSLACLYVIVRLAIGLYDWGIAHALFHATAQECQANDGRGACWAVIGEKFHFDVFGQYPVDQTWRPSLFMGLFVLAAASSVVRPLAAAMDLLGIVGMWAFVLVAAGVLMWGGILGLPYVPVDLWGGLPLTLLFAVVGLGLAFPLAILLALGRRSTLPVIKLVSVGYIELIRGVPLITVLFMSSVVFPLFLPNGVSVDKVLRAQVAFILFSAAYLAEVVRAGLVAVHRGQYEAADALGMGYWQKVGLIVLPQALRIVIPPLVNTFIATFKDTTLVVVIGLFDLLTAVKTAITDPSWRSFYAENYLFAAFIFFCFCFAMSKYSRHLERQLRHSRPTK